jgi:hypothetical protein
MTLAYLHVPCIYQLYPESSGKCSILYLGQGRVLLAMTRT